MCGPKWDVQRSNPSTVDELEQEIRNSPPPPYFLTSHENVLGLCVFQIAEVYADCWGLCCNWTLNGFEIVQEL